jgi:alkanesulfonate monooxygenase SsuD/methylene tetrahydromethanopterin reductase-like flavin-dependent oxidoreductase (luciferase family)
VKLKFGIRIELYQHSFEPVKDYVLAAERLGYDAVWANDHLLPIVGTIKKPVMECWTVLSALAGITSSIRLGSLVLNNSFRHPQLVAKMGSTLDVVSRGRLELGIGAGWFEMEHEMFGLQYRKHSERILMLREAIKLIKLLWTKKSANFKGRYYSVKDAVCLPQPVQKPHPPFLVGGHSDRILELVAEHADKSNFLLIPSERFAERASALKKKCERFGREYSKIGKSFFGEAMVVGSKREAEDQVKKRLKDRKLSVKQHRRYAERCIIGTSGSCIERIVEYKKAGAEEFMLVFPGLDRKQIQIFADSVISCIK